jgi:hypothetical protein
MQRAARHGALLATILRHGLTFNFDGFFTAENGTGRTKRDMLDLAGCIKHAGRVAHVAALTERCQTRTLAQEIVQRS